MIFMNDPPERRLDLQKYKKSKGQSVICHYRCTKLFDFDWLFAVTGLETRCSLNWCLQ